jgi:LmbE family N-acetylglucosaminyl deacetylase
MFGKRILVLSPHPDDEAVGAAAAIARARARGAAVSVAFLTNGVPGPGAFWPWQRAGVPGRVARRWAEAAAAARRLGFDVAFRQDIPTRTLKSALNETHALVAAVLGRLGVDMLWTPAYEGAHQDHDAANCLAAAFLGRVPVWEFAEYNNAGGRVLSQEFFAPNGGETVLELSGAETAEKRAVLALYASERGNLRHIGARREAFRPLPAYDYARPPHPGALFYQRFQWVWPRHPRVDYARPEQVSAALAAFRAGVRA